MHKNLEAGFMGFAVSDALGVPVEFLERSYLQKRPVKDMIGYGSHKVPEGTWSDDTSLMIAAVDSIIENESIDYDDIMFKFTEWYDNAKYTATDVLFDIGISTSKAISNYKNGVKAIECGPKGKFENGNGSLMRILPFVYYLYYSDYNEEEIVKIINEASSLTHGHEISCLGCKIYYDYVTSILSGMDKEQAYNFIKTIDYSKYYTSASISEYDRILREDIKQYEIDDIKSSGYVVHSLEASLWCTLNNDSFEDAVVTAVNLGSDTDTVGAITGSINGIIYGRNQIPNRWLDKLKKKEYLEELFAQFVETIEYGKYKEKGM